jgi:hypothetical protein
VRKIPHSFTGDAALAQIIPPTGTGKGCLRHESLHLQAGISFDLSSHNLLPMSSNSTKKASKELNTLSVVRHELKSLITPFPVDKKNDSRKSSERSVIPSKGYIRPPKHDFL